MYKNEIEFLKKVENKSKINERKKWCNEEIKHLVERYNNIPKDYIAYLIEIGTGSFRECQFVVYDLLETLDEIIEENLYDLQDNKFLVFGDNYCGDFSGFIINKEWQIAELFHDTGELYLVNKNFKEYIKEQMLIDN